MDFVEVLVCSPHVLSTTEPTHLWNLYDLFAFLLRALWFRLFYFWAMNDCCILFVYLGWFTVHNFYCLSDLNYLPFSYFRGFNGQSLFTWTQVFTK